MKISYYCSKIACFYVLEKTKNFVMDIGAMPGADGVGYAGSITVDTGLKLTTHYG